MSDVVYAVTRDGEIVSVRRTSIVRKFGALASASKLKSFSYTLEDGTALTQLTSGQLRAPDNRILKLVE